MTDTCILTLQCDDRHGLVADVATLLARSGCNILDAQQFNDKDNDRFFMRVEFALEGESLGELTRHFETVAAADRMERV